MGSGAPDSRVSSNPTVMLPCPSAPKLAATTTMVPSLFESLKQESVDSFQFGVVGRVRRVDRQRVTSALAVCGGSIDP